MKKIFTYLGLVLIGLLAVFVSACKKEKLSEVITAEDGAKVSLELPKRVDVAGAGNFSLDNSELTLPLTINFNGASTKAFTVNTEVNTDTVASLIADGTLNADSTIALESGKFSITPVVNIAYGVKSVGLSMVFSRSYLELNYGKNIAFVLKLIDPSKGNGLAAGKSAVIVVIKTGQAIEASTVHYIRFSNTTPTMNYPISDTELGYEKGSQDISFPVEVTLTGEAGAGFLVDVLRDASVITQAKEKGDLPAGAITLPDRDWNISNPKLQFEDGKNKVSFTITLRNNALIAYPDRMAMGIRLSKPTRWQLAKENTTLVIVFDPAQFKRKPFNSNAFVIKGGVGTQSDFIPASNYDLGGEGVAYHDNGGRDGGQFRRPDQVDIADNNITVGWTGDGEWLTYTIDVEEDGYYSFNAIIGAPGTDGRYSLFIGTDNVTGVLASRQTAGSYGDQRPNFSLVSLTKGKHVMKFNMDRGAYDVRGFQFTKVNKYDGKYTVGGTIVRNTATGPDTNLGGTIVGGIVRPLATTNTHALQFKPVWKDGSDVGGIDLTYLTIDPATNEVTVSSETNATLKNTPGKVNKYDPATKTFTLNFDWGTGDATRVASLTLQYNSARP